MKLRACALASIVSSILVFAGCSSSGSGDGTTSLNGVGGDSNSLHGGVGNVCNAAGDCPSGLACHTDSTDWIAHKQCASACQENEDCTSLYGARTMCIGAHICVAKCLVDSDCPSSTRCNENGWCEHAGPGSGVPACSGIPKSCSVLSESECTSALGCTSTGDCTGVAESCSEHFSSYTCNQAAGCYWSASSVSCTGFATSCSSNFTDLTCSGQSGCSWRSSCTGRQLDASCDKISPGLCKYTVGCSLVPQ